MEELAALEFGPYWRDHDIRFDVFPGSWSPAKNEMVLEEIPDIEDLKGDREEIGTIGLDTVVSTSMHSTTSKIRGAIDSIFLVCQCNDTRFEFIFAGAGTAESSSLRLATSIQAAQRAYQSTRIYREVKLRAGIIRDNALILLPGEKVYEKLDNVWNLANDQGTPGIVHITNIRFVWHSIFSESYNASIPFIQIVELALQKSRYGKCIVVETSPYPDVLKIGFRFEPQNKSKATLKMLKNFTKTFKENPQYGIVEKHEYQVPDANELPVQVTQATVVPEPDAISVLASANSIHDQIVQEENTKTQEDDPDKDYIDNDDDDNLETFTNERQPKRTDAMEEDRDAMILDDDRGDVSLRWTYQVDASPAPAATNTGNVVFYPEFGVAVESLPENVTMASLWRL